MKTASRPENVLLLNIPDMELDFNSHHFLCSSSGEFAEERMDFLATQIWPNWEEAHYSFHQLAEYLSQFDIELWTAYDVKTTRPMEFAFEVRFLKQHAGTVLVQCELIRKEQVH